MTHDESRITTMLQQLREVHQAIAEMRLEQAQVKDSILTPEQRQRLAEIDEEYAGKLEEAEAQKKDMEEQVRGVILLHEKTVEVEGLRATYRKPSLTWDSAAMERWFLQHNQEIWQQIQQFRKVGKPSTSLTYSKEK